VFGEIVINDQSVLPLVHKVLAYRTARVGRDVQHRCRVARRREYDGGVIHCAELFQLIDDSGDGGGLLADGDVDALGVFTSRLPVADDQFTLAPSDRNHRIDGLEARLERSVDRLSIDDTRRFEFYFAEILCHDRAFSVQGLA